jgi:hypothetical protein
MAPHYPEALTGQPPGFLANTTHLLVIMLISLLPAGCAFLIVLWALMIYKGLGGRVSLDVATKAALRVGLAVSLFLPPYLLPFHLFNSQNAAGITGLCLDVLVLGLGIAAAGKLFRRARTASIQNATS